MFSLFYIIQLNRREVLISHIKHCTFMLFVCVGDLSRTTSPLCALSVVTPSVHSVGSCLHELWL